MTDDPVRWGVLATGFITGHVLTGATGAPSVRIEAVASRDAGRAADVARRHGIARSYGSYHALLEDDAIEAVYIAVPNSLHVDLAIRALEAGKHVLCEKPLTARASEAARAFDVAERQGRLLSEAFMWRHLPSTHQALRLVGDGAIGTLERIRSRFSFVVTDPGDIRLSAELEGGSLMDIGCYCVNAARTFAGEPTRVRGDATPAASGVDMRFRGEMELPGSVTCEFTSSLDEPAESRLELVGSRGIIHVLDPWHGRRTGLRLEGPDGVRTEDITSPDPYGLELEDMSRAIRSEGTPLLGRSDAVGQARTIEALLRSAATGAPVQP